MWPGGAYYFVDLASVEVVNPQVDQACCLPDNACVILTPAECELMGGTPLGVGAMCGSEDPCDPTPAIPASWGKVKATYRD